MILNENDVIFFWGHTQKQNETIGKQCLSNFYPAAFPCKAPYNFGSSVEGMIHYHNSEHYYMMAKALFARDTTTSLLLAQAPPDPAYIKKLGREVSGFLESEWDKVKEQAMFEACFYKFLANPNLMEYLLSTEDKLLVEASPVDKIWGIGLSQDDPRALDQSQWDGENLLGQVLMNVRSKLRELQNDSHNP